MFCDLSKERAYGPFFFMETTDIGIVYLDMLAQLENDHEGRIHFQQDFAPSLITMLRSQIGLQLWKILTLRWKLKVPGK
jgi:hypothetical protein